MLHSIFFHSLLEFSNVLANEVFKYCYHYLLIFPPDEVNKYDVRDKSVTLTRDMLLTKEFPQGFLAFKEFSIVCVSAKVFCRGKGQAENLSSLPTLYYLLAYHI